MLAALVLANGRVVKFVGLVVLGPLMKAPTFGLLCRKFLIVRLSNMCALVSKRVRRRLGTLVAPARRCGVIRLVVLKNRVVLFNRALKILTVRFISCGTRRR